MVWFVGMALLAGVCISLSRQVNGRLALSKGALTASFWNHVVGLVAPHREPHTPVLEALMRGVRRMAKAD